MKSSLKWIISISFIVCIGIFCFIIFRMTSDIKSDFKEDNWYKDTSPSIVYDENDDNTDNGLAELVKENPDCVAWLRIDNTKIDYPIMQTKDNEQFYLRRNFKKEYSYIGTPFLNAQCDIDGSDNLIVYGHNMRDGTMFADLLKYRQKQFGAKNPVIRLITLNGCHRYIVCAVVKVKADDDWYTYINNTDEQTFNKLKTQIESKALYQVNGELKYGDKFLTLSTCEYSQTNGRLIVIAKRSDGIC